MRRSRWILPTIIFSQFCATSLWFAGNAVLDDVRVQWQLPADVLAPIASAVQLGFITGTLVFAFFSIPDRFSPRKVVLVCALAGALSNSALAWAGETFAVLLGGRFLTGFFLAGLYPVGMKIAAGWYREDLGRAIGFLVAALVLGTGFPHLLKALGQSWPWTTVVYSVSLLAAVGGLTMYWLVPDGPFLSKAVAFNPRALAEIFRQRDFRASALGYFGHMWELYAFWVFLPVFLAAHWSLSGYSSADVSMWTFVVIAAGSIGCAGGGLVSQRLGSARVAAYQLSISGLCCLISPLVFFAPTPVFVAFLLLWGLAVVGDSPQFSALNAAAAPPALVGSALTIANCIGFAITIVSIELLGVLQNWLPAQFLFLVLAAGPMFGLFFMRPLLEHGR